MENTIDSTALREAKLLQVFQAQQAKEETGKLARLSHILISLWELGSIVAKLSPGESLVICDDGSLHKGRVKTEKLQHLRQRFVGRKSGALDGDGAQEFLTTKSWVGAPSPAFKNCWDTAIKTSRIQTKNRPIMVDIFFWRLEEYCASDPTGKDLKMEITTDFQGFRIYELSIPDCTVTCGVGTSGRVYYYKVGGKIYEF